MELVQPKWKHFLLPLMLPPPSHNMLILLVSLQLQHCQLHFLE